MAVSHYLKVTYKISEGTCFEPIGNRETSKK